MVESDRSEKESRYGVHPSHNGLDERVFLVPIAIILIYSFLTKDCTAASVDPDVRSLSALLNRSSPVSRSPRSGSRSSRPQSRCCSPFRAPTSWRAATRDLFLFLIIIPFWTNFLIRIYAWIAILGNNGFLNAVLVQLRITDEYIQFLYNNWAVIIVLVYTYLPYAILPLYSTIEVRFLAARSRAGSRRLAPAFARLGDAAEHQGRHHVGGVVHVHSSFGSYAIPQLVGERLAHDGQHHRA